MMTNSQKALTTALTATAPSATRPPRDTTAAMPPTNPSGAHARLIQIHGPGSPSPHVATASAPATNAQPATTAATIATVQPFPGYSGVNRDGAAFSWRSHQSSSPKEADTGASPERRTPRTRGPGAHHLGALREA